MANEMVTLPAEAIPSLRRMLIVGLAAIAEIERVQKVPGLEESGDGAPLHPTGADEHGDFATAMMWLEMASPVEA